jgi:hypothetical protein
VRALSTLAEKADHWKPYDARLMRFDAVSARINHVGNDDTAETEQAQQKTKKSSKSKKNAKSKSKAVSK